MTVGLNTCVGEGVGTGELKRRVMEVQLEQPLRGVI